MVLIALRGIQSHLKQNAKMSLSLFGRMFATEDRFYAHDGANVNPNFS